MTFCLRLVRDQSLVEVYRKRREVWWICRLALRTGQPARQQVMQGQHLAADHPHHCCHPFTFPGFLFLFIFLKRLASLADKKSCKSTIHLPTQSYHHQFKIATYPGLHAKRVRYMASQLIGNSIPRKESHLLLLILILLAIATMHCNSHQHNHLSHCYYNH